MADGYGPAFARCVGCGAIELLEYGVAGLDVVEKLRASECGGDAVALRGDVGYGLSCGAAVHEK